MGLLSKVLNNPGDVHPASSPKDPIDPVNLVGNFLSISLGQTSCRDQELSLFLGIRQLIKHRVGFLTGRFNEPAGIDQDQVGLPGSINRVFSIWFSMS